jgi:biopolymer transport protein ExbB
MENVNLDLVALIQQGAISTYPLLFCSIVMLGVVLERLWSLRGILSSTATATAQVVPPLARGDVKGARAGIEQTAPSPARRVFGEVLDAEPGTTLPDLERVADERQFEEVQGCGAYLWILGTIGSSAPFIGLFGTVIGIVNAFTGIAASGSGGLAAVSAGIAEALITTAFGILVAVPAVMAFNYFTTRLERFQIEMSNSSAELLDFFLKKHEAAGAKR